MSVKVDSRLKWVATELQARVQAVGLAAAEQIAAGARERVPVGAPSIHLKDEIHVEQTGAFEHTVFAGGKDAFYGHIVEHGSVHSAPHPFLMPAAEVVRGEIDAIAKRTLAGL